MRIFLVGTRVFSRVLDLLTRNKEGEVEFVFGNVKTVRCSFFHSIIKDCPSISLFQTQAKLNPSVYILNLTRPNSFFLQNNNSIFFYFTTGFNFLVNLQTISSKKREKKGGPSYTKQRTKLKKKLPHTHIRNVMIQLFHCMNFLIQHSKSYR